MPTIEEALRSYLANRSPALSFGSRVYSHKSIERPTTPYLVFFMFDVDPIQTQIGPPSIRRRSYQFSAFSEKQSEAMTGADEVRALLDGFRGSIAGIDVRAIHMTGQRVSEMEPDTKLFQCSVDLRIQYLPS